MARTPRVGQAELPCGGTAPRAKGTARTEDVLPHHSGEPRERAWSRALDAAHHLRGDEWAPTFARALQAALEPDVLGLFMCPLGNLLGARAIMAPSSAAPLGERFLETLHDMHRAGVVSPALMLAEPSDPSMPPAMQRLLTEFLAATGFASLFGNALVASDGTIAGWVVVFGTEPAEARRAAVQEDFDTVVAAAETTVRSAMGIASLVGARFPTLSPEPLTRREQEVAELAADGFADVNIAQRLGIVEGTVGRHLHNIYRKLGVNSRLELSTSLCAASSSPLQSRAQLAER